MAKETGEVSDELIKRYERLAKGGVGLSMTGLMFVHPAGRGYQHQMGIHHDGLIQGLTKLVNVVHQAEGKYSLEEGYNLEAAKTIKPLLGNTSLVLVGGMRTVSHMEKILENNDADFISMSRPFIREPFLVNKIKEGKMDKVSCVSCNRCLAAIPNKMPVYCYNRGLPKG